MKAKHKNVISLALLVLSLALITLGLSQNQPQQVMEKAVQVCLECIGIG